jgi:hypothetical protein
MRLVYIDEAGISRDEPFLTVAAIIVDADRQLVALERNLDRLVEKWIPAELREDFVFHATELFNGGGKVFRRDNPNWTLERRLQIADDIAALVRKHRVVVTCGIVDKANFPQDPGTRALYEASGEKDRAVAAHVTAFSVCSLKVDRWMRENASNEVCLLIVEDNTDARALMRETQAYHQDKRIFATLAEDHRQYFPLRKIKEDPLFQKKRPSSVLQLADFCAYVSKRLLMKDDRYQRFVTPMLSQMYRTFDMVDAV